MFRRLVLVVTMLSVLLAVPAAGLDAQQKQWYVQGVFALPLGDFTNVADLGLGGGAGLSVAYGPQWSFRGEASYIWFRTKDIPGGDASASLVPLNALALYQLQHSQAYLMGGLGVVFASGSASYSIGNEGDSYSDTSTKVGLILGVGYVLNPKFDLGVRFNVAGDANHFSLNLAYGF